MMITDSDGHLPGEEALSKETTMWDDIHDDSDSSESDLWSDD